MQKITKNSLKIRKNYRKIDNTRMTPKHEWCGDTQTGVSTHHVLSHMILNSLCYSGSENVFKMSILLKTVLEDTTPYLMNFLARFFQAKLGSSAEVRHL